jgi:hypothetical protein
MLIVAISATGHSDFDGSLAQQLSGAVQPSHSQHNLSA